MKLDYKASKEEWKAAAKEIQGTIFGATRNAFKDLAAQVQSQGRSEIARAGLSPRWQRGFRTWVFPRRPNFTTNLVMRGHHRIGYANIFERGGQITGKPMLWVPLSTAPRRVGGKEVTASRMIAAGIRMFKVTRPGRPPLLMGYVLRSGPRSRRKSIVAAKGGKVLVRSGKVSVGQLKSGQRGLRRRDVETAFGADRLSARPVGIPLFVGLRSTKIGDRMNVSAVYDRGREALPDIYAKRIRELLT